MLVAKINNTPIYLDPTIEVATSSEAQVMMPQLIYTEECHGCIENFERKEIFSLYINQIKNYLITIAKRMEFSVRVHDGIRQFCENLSHHQNITQEIKKYLYTDLSECLYSFTRFHVRYLSKEQYNVRTILIGVFENLTNDVSKVLTDVTYVYAAINGHVSNKLSKKIIDRRLNVMKNTISQHIESVHSLSSNNKKIKYKIAYKYLLKKNKWPYSIIYKDTKVGRHILSATSPLLPSLINKLNQSTHIVKVIKDIGDDIHQEIEALIAAPGHHFYDNGIKYVSDQGFLEVQKFLETSNPPIDRYSVLERDASTGFHSLHRSRDALYGALVEELPKENNKEIIYKIDSVTLAASVKLKSFKDYYWVDYGGGVRGALTLGALRLGNVAHLKNDNLLRYAIINSPFDGLLKDYNSKWCNDFYKVFDNFYERNIFALYKLNFSNKTIDINRKDKKGNTVLHAAVYHNDIEACDYLIDRPDMNINCTNNAGITALMQAVDKGSMSMVLKLLESKHVNINITDKNSVTALAMAEKRHHKGIAILLKSHAITINSRERKIDTSDV
ncbi:ankyrin repeat domain-containing protein [Acerihabitans arboris]|uniref:Ankyrin repeat protein n=1 Tax=Acerihabitans arboris TaxID=2691583 RepID=A0A845SSQ9_9GAMM|nr:ankyrin repeat domain-containing protein [Acerihabitans arboris]NDL65886.1 hypothetical protein [Acerihabitans arboris]